MVRPAEFSRPLSDWQMLKYGPALSQTVKNLKKNQTVKNLKKKSNSQKLKKNQKTIK
jgi:hypothetical protein